MTIYRDFDSRRLWTLEEVKEHYNTFKEEGETFERFLNSATSKNGSLTEVETFEEWEEVIDSNCFEYDDIEKAMEKSDLTESEKESLFDYYWKKEEELLCW